MERKAFITGVAGQDGSYLTELLLEKDYRVYGLARHTTNASTLKNISHIRDPRFELIMGDITDRGAMERHLKLIKPHEVYNLASQSHVGKSFEIPELTTEVTGKAVLGLLEAIRASGFNSKFYQASTSELFGNGELDPETRSHQQNELSELKPVSPYGVAKLYAHHIARVYRESYNMFTCCGILFNHESPRRGPEFVTQKIALGAARIAREGGVLRLGNLEAKRDWGHARDYVAGMWMMMQHPDPLDLVLATGETHTIREFADLAFKRVGLEYQNHVAVDPAFFRPVDVNVLCGDSREARFRLPWSPVTSFQELVHEMVDAAMGVTNGCNVCHDPGCKTPNEKH